jgi:hypothetical protein
MLSNITKHPHDTDTSILVHNADCFPHHCPLGTSSQAEQSIYSSSQQTELSSEVYSCYLCHSLLQRSVSNRSIQNIPLFIILFKTKVIHKVQYSVPLISTVNWFLKSITDMKQYKQHAPMKICSRSHKVEH